ncbi:24284_t:CDS:2 [Gigaspora rosea]|nr:24284_t:CDS:2 [Gigaspora rosea]
MIYKISKWHEWTWPDEGEEASSILARLIPELGPWKKYTPVQIIKITKDHIFKKPEPLLSEHVIPPKSWTMPTPDIQNENITNKSNTEYQDNLMVKPYWLKSSTKGI